MKRILLIIGVVIASLTVAMPVEAKYENYTVLDGGSATTTETEEEPKLESVESGTCDGSSFLFMRPWYAGLDCTDGKINEDQFNSSNMENTIKKIVAVVIDDILRVVGILAAGFLIYGGLQYAYSGGDASKAAKGKRTIQASIIGLVIVLLAQVARNTFEVIITRAGGDVVSEEVTIGTITESLNLLRVEPEKLLGTAINFVLGIATMVSVGYIIYAAVTMMTAYGSPEKTARARHSIMYAVIGLIVSMLAFAIVNFVLGGLKTAMPSGDQTDIFNLINAIFGWVVGLGGLLAVAGIIVGGIQYTTSAGDANKVQKAKHTILYSVIGLVVALLAGVIVSFVLKAVFA